MADRDYTGFANAPLDDEGNVIDPLEVDRYVDESDEGKVRDASQTTESSIVKFRSEGPSTNGVPAAEVGKSYDESEASPESEPDAEDEAEKQENPDDADAAGGQGANGA